MARRNKRYLLEWVRRGSNYHWGAWNEVYLSCTGHEVPLCRTGLARSFGATPRRIWVQRLEEDEVPATPRVREMWISPGLDILEHGFRVHVSPRQLHRIVLGLTLDDLPARFAVLAIMDPPPYIVTSYPPH